MLSSIRITLLLNSAAFITRHCFALVPISKVFPTSGTRSLVKSAITVTVSNVVSPMRILPPSVIFPVTSTLPLTPKLPVTFVLANNSMLPVPTVLISKLLFVAVVSILLPTICMSSVRNGPPTMSPVTVNVPAILTLLLAVTGPVNVEEPFTFNIPKVAVPVTVSSPVTVSVDPLNVKLPLSTKRPLAPA